MWGRAVTIAPADRPIILHLARTAVEAAVHGRSAPPVPDYRVFGIRAGAFVTLTTAGDLRGCIGRAEPRDALGTVIVECAKAAALQDPRFHPVAPHELELLAIEVSILTPPVRVEDPASIEPGRHGLIVARDGRRGLLLPQVAAEWGWTRETFLAQTCRKAGLPLDAWHTGADIFAFEAEILSE